MLRRTAIIATFAVLLAAAGPAAAAPRVTFAKWALQIANAGAVQNASHPPGEPQPTCAGDNLRFAGVAGRYRGFPQGATIAAVFLLDGGKVARERYVVDDHGTFGLS